MSRPAAARRAPRVRRLRADDLDEVVRLDALHTGKRKPAYWRRVFEEFLEADRAGRRVGLAAEGDEGLVAYLLGEVRAFEFGSAACGWVFAIGVAPEAMRRGVASTLLAACGGRFRDAGVRHVRTMVPRSNVPVLSFFRANGFVGGSFVQLERDLGDARDREEV